MRIYRSQQFNIYIRALDHPPPHCHVRFPDGSFVCVTIPLIEPMYGATISGEIREAIENNLEALIDAWDTLHPERPKKIKSKRTNTNK